MATASHSKLHITSCIVVVYHQKEVPTFIFFSLSLSNISILLILTKTIYNAFVSPFEKSLDYPRIWFHTFTKDKCDNEETSTPDLFLRNKKLKAIKSNNKIIPS